MITENDHYSKLTGFYKGKVLQHLGKAGGRCRIFIAGVYPESWCSAENIKKIPPAELVSPIFGGGNGLDGMFSYPDIGSIVVCGFFNGDANMPYYIGTVLGGKTARETLVDHSRTDVTESNIADGTDVVAHTIISGNSRIKLYTSGQISISVKGSTDLSKTALADISVMPDGNITISGSNQIQLTAPMIKMNAATGITMSSPTITLDTGPHDGGQLTLKNSKIVEEATTSHLIRSPSIYFDAGSSTNGGSVIAVGHTKQEQPLAV